MHTLGSPRSRSGAQKSVACRSTLCTLMRALMKLLPALGLTAGLEKITKQADRTRMRSTFPDMRGQSLRVAHRIGGANDGDSE
jgi:hypothetical protein